MPRDIEEAQDVSDFVLGVAEGILNRPLGDTMDCTYDAGAISTDITTLTEDFPANCTFDQVAQGIIDIGHTITDIGHALKDCFGDQEENWKMEGAAQPYENINRFVFDFSEKELILDDTNIFEQVAAYKRYSQTGETRKAARELGWATYRLIEAEETRAWEILN